MSESTEIHEPFPVSTRAERSEPIPESIQKWIPVYKPAIDIFTDEFCAEGSTTKCVVIEGETRTGKTTFAAAVAYSLLARLEQEKHIPAQVFFTTAGLQQLVGDVPGVSDYRTGIKFDKLPDSRELAAFPGEVIIVLDEISKRRPEPLMWEKYFKLPNVRYLIAAHPGSPYWEEWKKLFPEHSMITSMKEIKSLKDA